MTRREHDARPAVTRYSAVTPDVIKQVRADYWAGRPLGRRIPGLDEVTAAIIVQDSLSADRLITKSLEEMLETDSEALSDWELAVRAELLLGAASAARQMEDVPPEAIALLETGAWAALEAALDSPTVSPMLHYQDIYYDVAEEYWIRGNCRAIDLLKRALAHDLRYERGNNAPGILRDLAEAHIRLGDLDLGVDLFAQLLCNDPADIWTYNHLAFVLDPPDLADLAIEVAVKGLALAEATGDPEELEEQLQERLEHLRATGEPGIEVSLAPHILSDLRDALALDFDAGLGLSAEALCRRLVPDLDTVPVKEPPQMPPLPPPPAQSGRPLSGPGRNDPCWCGSGRKYKRCHLRTDTMVG